MFVSKLSIFRAALTAFAVAALALPASQADAKPGSTGWQATFTFTVPTGTPDLFEHLSCPTGYSVQNGAYFALNAATTGNGFALTGQGPRLDLTPPQYGEWAWNFVWPNGGAAAGSQIVFNVLCKKGAA
jgi:hypothetical protein